MRIMMSRRLTIPAAAALLALAGALALSAGRTKQEKKSTIRSAKPAAVFVARATPERLARGRYLAETVAGCFDCHTPHQYMNGVWGPVPGKMGEGQVFPPGFIPLPPGSQVVACNITPDRETGIGSWTDADIEQAIRHGVMKGGKPIFNLMPYPQYRVLNDEDMKSIIVYLRSLPPIKNALPETKLPFPIRVDMKQALTPPLPKNASPLVRRGWYLTRLAGCADCHTPILPNGASPPSLLFGGGMSFHGPFGEVFSLNITPSASGIGFMDEAMFSRTLRTGRVNGNGLKLKPPMPFENFRNLKAAEIRAIYAYLRTVPKVNHKIDNTDPPTYCKIDGMKHGLGDRN